MGQITHLTFIDLETTAKHRPSEYYDSIVEVAAARVNLATREIEDKYETLIHPHGIQSWRRVHTVHGGNYPDWQLGEFHTKSGHFDGVDWRRGTRQENALNMLLEYFLKDGATIAGQNPAFDLAHLRRDCLGSSLSWPNLDYHVIDLASTAIFLQMAGIIPGLSLRHTAKWAGCARSPHRAMNDVLNSIDVFWCMHDIFNAGIAFRAYSFPAQQDPNPVPQYDGVLAMNEGCPEIDLSNYRDPLVDIPPEGFVT